MKKVSIFGVGSVGSRIAFFLARSRDIARIRLVDIAPGRSRATLLDFLESNVALRSKIMLVDYDEPKEIDKSDVVIVAPGVAHNVNASVPEPSEADIKKMEEIAGHIGQFTPQAFVAVLSQPAELFCKIITKYGDFNPKRVLGFPLLNYREWYRDRIAKLVGLSNEDVRITTVRTLKGEELVPNQCGVSGIPLTALITDPARLPGAPSANVMENRLKYFNYAPAAVVSEVTSELVSKRRQLITAICHDKETGAFLEAKVLIGPNGF